MGFLDWVPALTPSVLLVVGVWIARKMIATRLQKSVAYEFDLKLENIRSELRASEESMKAELHTKEMEIATLRNSAISALSNRQIGKDNRKLEAVDQLWSSVIALAPAKALCRMMTKVKLDEASEEASKRPEVRQLFTALGSGCDPSKLDLSGAEKAHPFVSKIAWAYYSAYLAINSDAMLRVDMLKKGAPAKGWIDQKKITDLVTAALPQHSEFIREHGPTGYYMLLDELEELLLLELDRMLEGIESDKATVERASKIVKISKEALIAGEGVP